MSNGQSWMFWESERARIELESGEVVVVDPGDRVFVESDEETGEIVSLLEHRKRLLN